MKTEEIIELLRRGEATSGLKIEPDALQRLTVLANGHPFVANILGQYAGLNAINASRTSMKRIDVDAALNDVVDEFEQQLSPSTRANIRHLAKSRGHAVLGRLGGYAHASHGLINASIVEELLPNASAKQICLTILDPLAEDGGIIEKIETEDGCSYKFKDGNAPLYLWLLSFRAEASRQVRQGTGI